MLWKTLLPHASTRVETMRSGSRERGVASGGRMQEVERAALPHPAEQAAPGAHDGITAITRTARLPRDDIT